MSGTEFFVMLLLSFAIHWVWLFVLHHYSITADNNRRPKKLNQVQIAKMLRNLDRDSSMAQNSSGVLRHKKPEKSEIIEDDYSDQSNASTSRNQPETLGTITALESGETYLTGKPIRIKIQGNHGNGSSSVYHSIKPEDDDWLRKKVEQIKTSN